MQHPESSASRRRLRFRHALIAACALLCLLLPAAALATPPGGPRPSHNGATVKIENTRVKAGGWVRVSGTKWPAGKTCTIKLDDEQVGVIGTIAINRHGDFNGRVRIPSNVFKVIKPGPRNWLRLLAPQSSVNHQSDTSVKKFLTLVR